MGVKVATTCLASANSTSFSHTFACSISSSSSKRVGTRGYFHRGGAVVAALVCRYVHRLEKPGFSGIDSPSLSRFWSFDFPLQKRTPTIRSICSASLESFSDEEFSNSISELALRFKLPNAGNEDDTDPSNSTSESLNEDKRVDVDDVVNFSECAIETPPLQVNSVEGPLMEIEQEPHGWPGGDEVSRANVERKANSVDFPVSLRIIKKKLQWEEGFREVGESAYCSMKKAFSSMVFIIRELHSFTLQMREALLYEDLQEILSRVQQEIHASFVWLFQRVFSHTPTFMVYVMILLANFTVYSMGHNTTIEASAIVSPSKAFTTTIEADPVAESQEQKHQKFDSTAIKTFSVSSSSGKTVSIGGIHGGGGNARPVANGTDGSDGKFDQSGMYSAVLPDEVSPTSSTGTARDAESLSIRETREEEELTLRNPTDEEISELQNAVVDGEAIDQETTKHLVSPVSAKIETDGFGDYLKTDLLYQASLSQDPNNSLLLANYAQFLYLVTQDYARAEEYFKKAVGVDPPDAEAYSKYAIFLWKAKNDLCAAEETYLEAISAEPTNSYYAANYAHFLWNTGAEDTCYPLDNSPPNL